MDPKLDDLFQQSLQLIPGGVHSPVRSFKGLHTTPLFMKSGQGAYLTSVDNKNYLDFCMSFGPLILGHKDQEVEEALIKALSRGWTYGTCEPYSLELANYIIERIPFIEQIRFVNSGTEAVMTALRLARGVTGKNKIIKFNGCYHGHTDSMLIKAGSGLAGTSEASSLGVSPGIAQDTLILNLDDLNAVEETLQSHRGEIAALIIEPLPANYGLLPQRQEFLQGLRKLTRDHQVLLIFDEVISGFRVAFAGMAEQLDITPDIVTYGKIIGGGLPVGALASSKEIMEHLAPVGGVYQAGTLSANPLAMIAGLATLKRLTGQSYQALAEQTKKITTMLQAWFADQLDFQELRIVSYSSLFWIVPGTNEIRSIDQIPSHLTKKFGQLFQVLLDKGIYLSPNGYEVGFVSLAHNQAVLDELQKRLES